MLRISRKEWSMALAQVMEDAAKMAAQGAGREQIAQTLGVSMFWIDMLMDTDAFTYAVEVERERLRGKDAQG